MGPKVKEEPRVLTRDDLLRLMPADEADLILAEALAESHGEPIETVTMTADDFKRWMVDGPDDPFSKT